MIPHEYGKQDWTNDEQTGHIATTPLCTLEFLLPLCLHTHFYGNHTKRATFRNTSAKDNVSVVAFKRPFEKNSVKI